MPADSAGIIVSAGRWLAHYFGPIGLVVSAGLVVWLVRYLRRSERRREVDGGPFKWLARWLK